MSHPLFPRKRSPSPREAQRVRRGFGALERAAATAKHRESERARGGRTIVRSVALSGASKSFTLNLVDEDQPDTVIPYAAQTVYAEGTGTGTLGHRRALFARPTEGDIVVPASAAWTLFFTARMAALEYTKGGSGGNGQMALAVYYYSDPWNPAELTWNNQPAPEATLAFLAYFSLVFRSGAGDTAGESPVLGFTGFGADDWPLAVAAAIDGASYTVSGFAIVADFISANVLTGDTLEAGPFTLWERYT